MLCVARAVICYFLDASKNMHFAGAGERGLEYWIGTEDMDRFLYVVSRPLGLSYFIGVASKRGELISKLELSLLFLYGTERRYLDAEEQEE